MSTPGFGTNHYAHKPPTPASGQTQRPQSEQRNLVPIICAIAILIALLIAGIVIWNDVRSTSQASPEAGSATEQETTRVGGAAPEESTLKEETADDEEAANEQAPETSLNPDAADVPEGLTAAGWSDYPEARCQQGENMIFAAHGSDPDSHIVVCEKQNSLFYRGVWSSGAAFGPARGEGSSFSATILDPTSGDDTGSVLNIRGADYDIDGETGKFEDYWPH
ncbi:hypothetical protein FNY88_06930 [Corynebacterium guaraldiae]|uniref:DUF3515 family protein n=1 Tax=Corynebacterium guaraldiae TaxID=3051103 RepID=A0ABY3CTK8_9CORY|nr:hypothetical protein [Corynebacterium guaraldiae]TRX48844.1 hypothetical protein FNY88_06930 [Corynebacterium guaraldiae]